LVSGLGIKLLILLQFLPAIFTDGALVMLNAECAASRCRRLVLLTSVAYISLPADAASRRPLSINTPGKMGVNPVPGIISHC
jgi:hypothetical protein